jgi:exopolyphosphatase/guanosine-5'-triphosphate,3'-diphosphate pyrophosphatase
VTEYATLAAVDLGSNSFRLQVARIVDDQLYPLDSLKETVRLAGGLGDGKMLDQDAQERALACLSRFHERLRGLPEEAVRAVGTNTLRVAKNASQFLAKAQDALGFPIEVIAGLEEARLISLGVAHSLPPSGKKRFVVDIGGGSTELIIGSGLEPIRMESLYIGSVSFTKDYFADGRITASNLKEAELAARAELQTIRSKFSSAHWKQAVGSSGTARALDEILELNSYSKSGITAEGLAKLRSTLIKAGDYRNLRLAGLREERAPILAGGFAIMNAVFSDLDIEEMISASGALREGVLYDLLGRFHHHDMRDTTIAQFMRRYSVDQPQAKRVTDLASELFMRVEGMQPDHVETCLQLLAWAGKLHEIGISVSYSGYHKHSAYIIENADMPGFSRMEQQHLGLLVHAHRGTLSKISGLVSSDTDWLMILIMRLAAIFHRGRNAMALPRMRIHSINNGFHLEIDERWLKDNPLTEHTLKSEIKEWKSVGVKFGLAPYQARRAMATAQ